MNKLKSHFTFSKNERSGFFVFIIVLLIFIAVFTSVDFKKPTLLDTSSAEVVSTLQEIDSLKQRAKEASKPKLYPFNPNFISDYKAYTLGLTPNQYDKLKSYREANQWINSSEDFKKVTGVSDSLLRVIAPYFKFPEWVQKQKSKTSQKKYVDASIEKPFEAKLDLNLATATQLQQVNGIGNTLSNRIIKYRDKLGGFTSDVQLYNVYGLDAAVIKKLTNVCTVKSPKQIDKININSATASDLATIPGISYELAKKIWEFRRLREEVTNLSELTKIQEITPNKLAVIQLYLSVQ